MKWIGICYNDALFLFLLFLHFFLNRWAHNASVKCDRMRSQKIRRRPESCHAYHPQVNTHILDGSQTCIARMPSDYNLSTYKIRFSDIKKSLIHILCILSVLGKCQGLWRGCGNQPVHHAVSSLFISVCTHPSMTEGLLNAQESHP